MRRADRVISRIALAFAAALFAQSAFAQSYPTRTVRIIVPNAPGGPTDIVARVVAQKMAESMGQPVVVENRLGAGGVVGTESVARAAPDGYTIMFSAAGAMVITPHLTTKLPYEPLRDFAPVALAATAPMILIVPANGAARSVAELIAQAKAQPGRLNYATAGIGTVPHLGVELLKSMVQIDVVHVPYKGATQADAATMSGEVTFMFTQPAIVTLARAGKVRMLGISSAKRSSLVPDVPTIAESGVPGFEVTAWYGAFAPAKTPDAILARLNAEIVKVLQLQDAADRLRSLGFEPPTGNSLTEFRSFVHAENAKWSKVVQDAGIKIEQ